MEAALASLSARGPQELLRVTRTALKIVQDILSEEEEKLRKIRTASKVRIVARIVHPETRGHHREAGPSPLEIIYFACRCHP